MRRPSSASPRPPPGAASASADYSACVAAALARRATLLADPQTDVARLFNSATDGIDGLVIEKLGPVLIAQLHSGRLQLTEDAVRALCADVAQRCRANAVYRKDYPQDRTTSARDLDARHRDPTPWLGEPVEPEFTVFEAGVRFLVRPYDGYATGLFLDHRAARAQVRTLAAGRRVLNTFAYTCGFTVAAALGGAAATVSVDLSKKYLEWGKRNLAVNGIALDPHRFICSDIFAYYRRAVRQGHRFDLVILDPPTFARRKDARRPFSLLTELEPLVSRALALLDPGGLLHLSVNHRGTSQRRLEQVVVAAAQAQRRHGELLTCPPLPDDFRGDPDFAKSLLARID